MSRTFASILAAAILVMALAACALLPGDSGTPDGGAASDDGDASASVAPSPGTRLNACEVVTRTDIEMLLGLEPHAVKRGRLSRVANAVDPYQTRCRYEGPAWGRMTVEVTPASGQGLWAAVAAAYDDALPIEAGPRALWSPGTHRAFVAKRSVTVMLEITLVGVPPSEWGGMASQLAQLVEARL